ncbi:GH25 family lysozyme [Sporolactobacillus pectinivorans]|uniref:GH25 family lysozyme n=1 Tax=Sporolactobacillus pectinivorans TaxID=1591408 RepID=UPI000C2600F5|nr:GH25 family lysozyme [Sporolactobacillus pectinivorans]
MSKESRIALDVEVPLGGDMSYNAHVFLSNVYAAGYQNVTWYSYQPFIDAHLDESKLPVNPWKVAYPTKADLNKPPFKNVGAWQYTDGIKLVGISGTFDCSVDYNGAFTSRAQAKKAVQELPSR